MAALLNDHERSILKTELANWAVVPKRDAITRTYSFKDFKSAFAFMTQCALHAEAMNHHPEWTNVYNRVMVRLTTHDAGHTITPKDHQLAQVLDEQYARFQMG